ncbi:translocation/assembly module TamB domain-containing protein [Pectinatus sottacetonis]|uniref:translocation/assembly module TamB domain-containing protein n=1 Tax=Pectinatus sottacetonis TaxID=1002795 RepID=UPI0018C6EC6D|nr:translocation/assembly module TamB domain-containing protein [Pectinatus sottacetonis]
MKKPWKKIAIFVVAFICIFIAASFFYISHSESFMKRAAKTAGNILTQSIHTKINIQSVKITSFSTIQADGVAIYDKKGILFLQSNKVGVKFNPWRILTGKITESVNKIIVNKPQMNIIEYQDGTWNYNDILVQNQTNNAFRGNIVVKDGLVNGNIKNKKLIIDKVNAKIDLSDSNKTVFKIDMMQESSKIHINGFMDKYAKHFNIRADKIDIMKYRIFIPSGKIPSNLKIKAGIINKLDISVNIPANGKISVIGQLQVTGGKCQFMDTNITDIKGLVILKDKYAVVFANAAVKGQLVKLHGKITIETDPKISMTVSANKINPHSIFKESPFNGDVKFTADVTGSIKNPVIAAELSAGQGQIYGYSFSNAKVQGNFSNNKIYLDKVSANCYGGIISAEGIFDLSSKKYQGHAQIKNISAKSLPRTLPALSGKISADAVFKGTINEFDDMVFYAVLSLENGSYNGIQVSQANAVLSKSAGQMISLQTFTADLVGKGNITASGSLNSENIDVDFYGSNVDLSLLNTYMAVPLSGRAEFHGYLQGNIADPYLTIKLGASDGQIAKQPYHTLLLSASGNANSIHLDKFVMKNDKNNVVHSAIGTIGLKNNHPVDLIVNTKNARMENIAAAFFPGQPITGNIDNTLHLTGTFNDIKVQGHVFFHEGSYHGVLLTAAYGNYVYESGNIILKDFIIKTPFLSAKISGEVDNNKLDFAVDIDRISLAKLPAYFPYPIKGEAGFTGHVGGTFDNIIFTSTVKAEKLIFNGVEITDVIGQCNYQNGILSFPKIQCRQDKGTISLQGKMDLQTKQLMGNLNVNAVDIKSLAAIADFKNKYLTGTFNGIVNMGGNFADPFIHLDGNIKNGYLKKYPLQNIVINVSYRNNIVQINKFYGEQGAGKVAAKGTWNINGPIDIIFSTQGINAKLMTELMNYDVDAKGIMNAYAQIKGTTKKPQADVSFEIDGGGIGTATFDRMTGLLNLKDGVINVNQILVNKGQYKASASGRVPIVALKAKPWEMLTQYDQIDLDISLDNADLSILPFLSKDIDWAAGPLQGRLKINGTLAHPLFDGFIKMHNGTVKLKGLVDPIQNMQADIVFNREKMKVNDFSGKIGSGKYSLVGDTLLTGGGLRDYKFTLNMDKLSINSKYYRGPFSAQCNLTEENLFGRVMPKLTGTVNIEKATISFPGIPDNNISILPKMILDLGINVGKNVRFASSMLYDMDISGNIHFGGTTKYPLPSGEIIVDRGTINYLKTIFKIREGVASFNQIGSFFPSIVFKADTELMQTKVFLSAEGPVEKMKFTLVSEPAMSQEEIIKLLTFRNNYREGGRIGSADLAELASIGFQMSFFNEIGNFMRDTLKLDEFNVVGDTIYNGNVRNNQDNYDEVYNIEIGKYISNKMMLKYTNSINYDDYKYGVQYDLNNNISILNEWDKKDGYKITLQANIKF